MKIATGFYIEGSNNRHLNLKVSKMELLHQYKFWGPNFRGNFCEFLNRIRIIPSVVFEALSTGLLD